MLEHGLSVAPSPSTLKPQTGGGGISGKATRTEGLSKLKALETALPQRARPPPSLCSQRDTASGPTNTSA
eukprot:scaffold6856_cov124-Isochrysis_galbana.AAC.7